MKIDFARSVIELTKDEMKKAENFGSPMYNDLMTVRRDNPGFRVVEIKAKKVKTPLDKLNMATIKAYVKAHGSPEQKKEFLAISIPHYTEDDVYIEAKPFVEIKKWFLAEFPKYREAMDNHEAEMKKIFDAVNAKIEAAKAKAAKDACEKAHKEVADYLAAS